MSSFSNNHFARMATPEALGELKKTNVFAESLSLREDIPTVSWNDIGLSQYLGESGSCSVFQVKVFASSSSRTKSKKRRRQKRQSLNNNTVSKGTTSGSEYQKLDGHSDTSSCSMYSLKCLNLNTSRKDFVFSAMDLLFEAGLLANLQHDNIVQLRGVCEDNLVKAFQKHDNQGYFFLYDSFSESLRDRLLGWRESKHKLRSRQRFQSIRQSLTSHQRASSSSLAIDGIGPPPLSQRLEDVALGVANAMAYLREKRIVHRDLQPETIGFDAATDTVKICDFGLARPVDDVDDVAGCTWYLAPEYARGYSCGFQSDVYSFGVVLYELVTLKIPFRAHRHNVPLFTKLVLLGGERPPLDKVALASESLSSLIEACWDGDPKNRPKFSQIAAWIEEILDSPFTELLDDTMKSASTSIISSVIEHYPPAPASTRKQIAPCKKQNSILERQLNRLRLMGRRQLAAQTATAA